MDAGTLLDCSAEDLDQALTQIFAGRCAVHQAELELIWAFDQKGCFADDGATSMAGWLSLRFGWSAYHASAAVRVARALAQLPSIREAYGQGRICWESVEALSRVATPENESELLDQALVMPASELKALLASLKPLDAKDAERAHQRRFLRFHWDLDRRMLLQAALADADGAVVAKALEHLASRRGPEPAEERPRFDQACADGLVEVCSSYLEAEADAVRATVVVHLDVETLKHDGSGMASLEDGPMVAGQTALRLCDCHAELVVDGAEGPIGIGRRSRQVPGWLWRVLKHRDRSCRFPGCERTRWVHAHHIEHWSQGGPTDKDNLVLLCWHRHRLVHEGGWSIKGNPDRWLDFVNPRGEILTSLPPPAVETELKEDLLRLFRVELLDPPDPPESALGN